MVNTLFSLPKSTFCKLAHQKIVDGCYTMVPPNNSFLIEFPRYFVRVKYAKLPLS